MSERSYLIPNFIESPLCVKDIFLQNSSLDSYTAVKTFLESNDLNCTYYLTGVSQYQLEQRLKRYEPIIEQKRNYSVIILFTRDDFKTLNRSKINKFYNATYFTPLYNNSEVYIFGVNPEPGVPFQILNKSKEATKESLFKRIFK